MNCFRVVTLAIALWTGLQSVAAAADPTPAPPGGAQSTVRSFSIPPQALSNALLAFGEQAGVQFSLASDLVAGKRSPGLSGRYRVEEALRVLLTGTGLTYRFSSDSTVMIEKAPNSGARVLGPVQVEGLAHSGVAAGVNGSTDPTATEGTHSYTSSALSIASKSPQSIKDTPQSVSVVTQQRLQDQNITDFMSLMNQMTGVTVATTGGNLDPIFYSRGFAITTFQVDGGAPFSENIGSNFGGYYPVIDLTMYDHAEILRGADGLFNGYGTPNGSVNLTRKRPLDHEQVTIEGAAGSWSNYREMIDATAPLGFDGALRGRVVVNNQSQDYFYDTADSKHTLIYGMLEADLTPLTTVSAGFDNTRQYSVPAFGGLPRYENGDDPHLPRSECLCFPWNYWNFDTDESFAQLDQRFSENWSGKLNFTHIQQDSQLKYGEVGNTIVPYTNAGNYVFGEMGGYSSRQTLVDMTVDGSFELFGHRQQILLGANYQDIKGNMQGYGTLFSPPYPPVNVFAFNPADPAYAEPPGLPLASQYPDYGEQQAGLYGTLHLTLLDPLHLVIGARYSYYKYSSATQYLCTDVSGSCTQVGAVRTDITSTPIIYSTHNITSPPTASLVYDLSKSIAVYAGYTDIYQSNATDLDHAGNPVEPTTGSNIEAGVKWAPAGGALNASLAVYRLEEKNFPKQTDYGNYPGNFGRLPDGVHSCCYANTSNLVYFSQGVDAEVTGQVLPGWQIYVGYTYNVNKYEGSDAVPYYTEGSPLVSLSPKHLLKSWTSYQFQKGEYLHRLSIGGGINGQTSAYTSGAECTGYDYGTDVSGNPTAICKPGAYVAYNYTQRTYAVAAGRVAYQIDRHWNAALNVNNITDKRYFQTMGSSTGGNWYGDPRNFMLTIRGSF